ncbi:rCG57379 [Rattus norvegicus]|uniref:RCG57379 n=1 Tax=Rattus norvegicus TaxID=10116 RepID=A6JP84_RAT|nr:rCG57379 [Rattus norvegicus]
MELRLSTQQLHATVPGVVQRGKKCRNQQKETGSDGLSSQPPCEKGQGSKATGPSIHGAKIKLILKS